MVTAKLCNDVHRRGNMSRQLRRACGNHAASVIADRASTISRFTDGSGRQNSASTPNKIHRYLVFRRGEEFAHRRFSSASPKSRVCIRRRSSAEISRRK